MKKIKSFMKDNRGIGTIEIVLIIVVLVGVVLIFKSQIQSLLETVFDKIMNDSSSIML